MEIQSSVTDQGPYVDRDSMTDSKGLTWSFLTAHLELNDLVLPFR